MKGLLKNIGIIGVVGVGAGMCGAFVARRKMEKARQEIKEIHEQTTEDKMENLEARINRLERTGMNHEFENTYWMVAGFILAVYMCHELDGAFNLIRDKHNGLVRHVADTFGAIGNVCEDFDNRIGAMEVK